MMSIIVKFILVGIIINFIFTVSIHWLLIKKIANVKVSKLITIKWYIKSKYLRFKRRHEESSLIEKGFLLFKVLGSIIFTDILVADFFKMKLGTDKEKKKRYITRMNYTNLTVSLIFIILAFTNINLTYKNIVIPFIVVRALSRSYEILIAFSRDVVNKSKKTSALSASDRLTLAINSFIEIIINYSIVYYVVTYISFSNIEFFVFVEYANILSSLFKSIGVSTLTNVGDLTLVSTMQLFSSMSLIYFGLAGYIGSNDNEE